MPQPISGVFIPFFSSPPVRVIWSAKKHIMDSLTENFKLFGIPVKNIAKPPNLATYVIMGSACRVVAKMVPVLASNSNFGSQYLKNYTVRQPKT